MTDEYAVKYLDDLAEKNHNLDVSWDMREAVRMGRDALRDRIARQNPQPLTLEELRGMDGEPQPVYLVSEIRRRERVENLPWHDRQWDD